MELRIKPTDWYECPSMESEDTGKTYVCKIAIVNRKVVVALRDNNCVKFCNYSVNKDRSLDECLEHFQYINLDYLRKHIKHDLLESCEEFNPDTGYFRWGSGDDYKLFYEDYRERWFNCEFADFIRSDSGRYSRRNRFRSNGKFTKLQWDYLLNALRQLIYAELDIIILGAVKEKFPEAKVKRASCEK